MLPKQCNTAEEQAQTRRDDYRGKQCTTWVGMTLPSAPRHLLASALLPEMAQRFRVTSSTMVRAAIPTPGTAPVTGRCTSYGTPHPIRTGALPTDRVQHPHSQVQPRTKPVDVVGCQQFSCSGDAGWRLVMGYRRMLGALDHTAIMAGLEAGLSHHCWDAID